MDTETSAYSSLLSNLSDAISKAADEVKAKRDAFTESLQDDAEVMHNYMNSLPVLNDDEASADLQKLEAKLADMGFDYSQLCEQSASVKDKIKVAKQALESRKQELSKKKAEEVQPRARYSVNVFRDMSNINWQAEHGPGEIKGFVWNKTSLKTFCFDKEKQSNFFIANSLWEMGDEGSDEELSHAK